MQSITELVFLWSSLPRQQFVQQFFTLALLFKECGGFLLNKNLQIIGVLLQSEEQILQETVATSTDKVPYW